MGLKDRVKRVEQYRGTKLRDRRGYVVNWGYE